MCLLFYIKTLLYLILIHILSSIYVHFSVDGLLDLLGLGDIDWDEVDWDSIEDYVEEDSTAGAERDDTDDNAESSNSENK